MDPHLSAPTPRAMSIVTSPRHLTLSPKEALAAIASMRSPRSAHPMIPSPRMRAITEEEIKLEEPHSAYQLDGSPSPSLRTPSHSPNSTQPLNGSYVVESSMSGSISPRPSSKPVADDDDAKDDSKSPPSDQPQGVSLSVRAAEVAQFTMARIITTLFFIAMVWATSLTLALWIASSFVGSVGTAVVVESWRTSFLVADIASESYAQCISNAHRECSQAYNVSFAGHIKAQNDTIAFDAQLVVESQDYNRDCTTASIELIAAIQSWMSAGARVQYNRDACSEDDIEIVKDMIGDDSVDESVELVGSTDVFLSTTSSLLSSAAESASNRTSYDAHYVSSKVGSINFNVDALRSLTFPFPSVTLPHVLNPFTDITREFAACVSGSSTSNSLCQQSLAQFYQPILDDLRGSLASTQSQMRLMATEVASYSNRVVGLLEQCATLITAIGSITGALDGLDIRITLPSLPTPLPRFSFSGDISVATAVHAVQQASDSFGQFMQPIALSALNSVDNAKADVNDEVTSLMTSIESITLTMPTLFEDYNPPPTDYQVSAIGDAFDTLAASHLNSTKAAVKGYETRLATSYNNSIAIVASISNYDAANISTVVNASQIVIPQISRSSFSTSYAKFTGSIDLSGFLDSLSGFFGSFLVLDWVYRGYRTIRIVTTQLRTPAAYLQPVDARVVPMALTRPAASWAAWLLAHPMVIYGAAGIILGLAAYPLSLLYIAAYKSYVQGCVTTTDGTLLSANSGILLVNLASAEGRALDVVLTGKFDAHATYDCMQRTSLGALSYGKFLAQIESTASQSNASGTRIALLNQCIDMPASFNQSKFSSSTKLPPTLPQSILTTQIIDQCRPRDFAAELIWPTFNCATLPSCSNITTSSSEAGGCGSGPSSSTITVATFNSACQTEYAIHSSMLLYALALLTFICMNISRSCIVAGLVRWCWRWLSPAGLQFMGNVNEKGMMSRHSALALRDKARDAVRSHEIWALRFFIIGLVVHLPYWMLIMGLGYTKSTVPAPQQMSNT